MIASLPSKVAVVGLGYVGLPLATAFSKVLPTIGFDINPDRIAELRNGLDRNGEIDKASLGASPLELTFEPSQLRRASLIIVAVPTPVDKAKRPDLSPLIHASRLIGKNLTAGTIVVYESTVYPGCTEEVCIPVLESESKVRIVADPFGENEKFDAVVLAVPHKIFRDIPAEAYIELLANHDRPAVFVDVKSAMSALRAKKDLLYWSL